MEHVARARWVRWGPRAARSSRRAPDGPNAASRLGGPFLVLASSASLQSSAALATTVFAVYGPAGTGALRFAFAAPVLWVVARPRLRGRTRRFWLSAVALGVTLPVLNLMLYEAIDRIALGSVVTLQYLGPLALALAGVRRRLDLAWVAAAGVGVGLITGGVALRAVNVKAFSLLLSLDPAIAAVAGTLWLGQRLSASEALGVGLVVLASSGVIAARRP
jgi:inner membrane transporter RhtA